MIFFYSATAAFALFLVAFRVAELSAEPDVRKSRFQRRYSRLAANGPEVDSDNLDPALTTSAVNLRKNGAYQSYKRVMDIVLSLALLVITAPLLALTAAAIRLESKGPVIYRQTRVGEAGRLFQILKFRSMVTDAEKDGARYADKNDARITRVGRIIRKLRIDEIPQAINVLRGEMSFVGPRPERPEFVSDLEREIKNYHSRHLVRPGITGWAQVKYEYAATVEGSRKKLRYDLFYVLNQSLWLDLAIILMTVRVAIFGLGAR